ncbi:MAG: LysR family transcriptional regulator [Peptococcaceae bacterium]|jgi:DNA-binding transcriptional LysR family regulator|nr:LysR family transcriptional regulator [Peptococcaceae bacterium]
MSILRYDVLIKVVELGSLSKAAELLGYTQPGISHILNALEEEWGVQLLTRGRSGVQLTTEGELLLPTIRQVCSVHGDLLHQVSKIKGVESGTVRLGTIKSVSAYYLPGIIKAFKQAHPDIRFELFHGEDLENEEWIAAGKVDCGFTLLPTFKKLTSIDLYEDQMMAILPEDYPVDREAFPIRDFEREPFIYHAGGRKNVEKQFEALGVKPNIQFTVKDEFSAMQMVEAGLGISLFSEMFLRRTSYRVKMLPLDPPNRRRLGLVYNSRSYLSHAAKEFIAFIKNQK